MKLFNKKGDAQETTFGSALVFVLIIVGILVPTLTFIYKLMSPDAYRTIYISKDIGLTLSTLYGMDSHVLTRYPEKLYNYSLDIKKDSVTVQAQNTGLNLLNTYQIIPNKFVILKEKKLQTDKLVFKKQGNNIDIQNETELLDFPIVCSIPIKAELKKMLILYDDNEIRIKDMINAIPKADVANTDILFSNNILDSSTYNLLIKIEEDKKNTNRISIGYSKENLFAGYFSCNMISMIEKNIDKTSLKEMNYFPELKKSKNLITLKIGSAMFYGDNAKKIGDTIYETISFVKK